MAVVVGPLIAKRIPKKAAGPQSDSQEVEELPAESVKKMFETKVLVHIPKYSDLQQ